MCRITQWLITLPAIVMAHGFSAVKEMFRLSMYAEHFERAGFIVGYHPTASIELISPTPLLMILAEQDSLIPVELARAAFDRAGDPKELHTFPRGHFEVYESEPWFTKAVSSMVEWSTKYLGITPFHCDKRVFGPIRSPRSGRCSGTSASTLPLRPVTALMASNSSAAK